jgi:Protein of unknown function (DUF1397)
VFSGFVAEKGLECVVSKQEELAKCYNDAIGEYKDDDIESLQSLITDEEFCQDMDGFKECAVMELKTCKPPQAHVFENFFDVVRKEMPCENDDENSADSSKLSVGVLAGTLLIASVPNVIFSLN